MKKAFYIYILLFISGSIVISSCTRSDSPANPGASKIKLGEGYAAGAATKVELYADKNLITGYNKLYIALFDSASNAVVEDAHVHLMPMMDMGTMQHGTPFDNPVSSMAVNHLFPCSISFLMGSNAGNWTLELHIHNHLSGKSGDLTIPLQVAVSAHSTLKTFISKTDGNSYAIAMVEPSSPKVGSNDFEIALYKKAADMGSSMADWSADSSLQIKLRPEMPSMGHGSPNNVDPIHIGNGHYKGKLNLTMTGLWWLHLDSYDGTDLADSSTYLELSF